MKTIYLLLATALLASCTGADLEKNEGVNDKTIVGTWEFFEINDINLQGTLIWTGVGEASHNFIINGDGTFKNLSPYTNCDTGTYTIVNNRLITVFDCPNGILSNPDIPVPASYDYEIISFESNEMILSPRWGFSFEGDSWQKYRRID